MLKFCFFVCTFFALSNTLAQRYYYNASMGLGTIDVLQHNNNNLLAAKLGQGYEFNRTLSLEAGLNIFFNKYTHQYNTSDYTQINQFYRVESLNYAIGVYLKPNFSILLKDRDNKTGELFLKTFCEFNFYQPFSNASYSSYQNKPIYNGKGEVYTWQEVFISEQGSKSSGIYSLNFAPGSALKLNLSKRYDIELGISWTTINWTSAIQLLKFGATKPLGYDEHLVRNLVLDFRVYFH